jgi:uncharacterized protein (TIGR03437 family)
MMFRRFAILVGVFSIPLLGQQDRIRGPLDYGRKMALAGKLHPKAQPRYDLGPADPSLELNYLTLMVKPSPDQQASLERLLADQQTRSSPSFHKWLTPEEYGDRFGLSRSDIARIVGWLQSEGLAVNDVARGRHWITFSGSAEHVSRAFATAIHRYSVDGETHFANALGPSVPAAFADVISGVRGLDDFGDRVGGAWKRIGASDTIDSEAGGSHYLAPDDLATIYGINPLYRAGIDGSGQSIAIVGQSNISLEDIRAFRGRFHLPPNDPQVTLVGPDPGIVSSFEGEADLDIEWSGAVARNATIQYVYARGVRTAAQYAVDHNIAPVISMSFSHCEPEETFPDFRAVAQQANAQGITWLTSSGDSGATGCDLAFNAQRASKGFAVSFLASMPEVTAVGGTRFDESGGTFWNRVNDTNLASALSYIPETAWNETGARGLSASGGGSSVIFTAPAWQAGVSHSGSRQVPDVSLSSAGHDGYLVISGGVLVSAFGTSAAAPTFAGIVALLNQYVVSNGIQAKPGLGNINPDLYRLAQIAPDAFHDIISGDNIVPCVTRSLGCETGSMGYQAGPGYDLVTGLGSVDANKLITQWNSRAPGTSTALAADSSDVAWGSPMQLTATVTSSAGAPTGNVSFVLGDTPLGEVPLDSSAKATFRVDTSQVPVGNQTFSAVYSGDSTFESSSGSTTVNVSGPPGGSVVIASISPNPIVQAQPDATGSRWIFNVTLTEVAGVSTAITGYTINNATRAVATDFGSSVIPALGKLTAGFVVRSATPLTFRFNGMDDSGQTWSRTVTVAFQGALLQTKMALAGASSVAQQNPDADPSCKWSQQLLLEEDAGFSVQLTKLLAGSGVDLSSQIPQLFGTARLAPFGLLRATICLGADPPAVTKYEVDGVDDLSATVVATWSSAVSTAAPSGLSVSSAPVTISDPKTLDINITGDQQAWSAQTFPANATAQWLSVSPSTGAGSGQITLGLTATGFPNGVYRTTLVIRSAATVPQAVSIPVALVVGGSSTTAISGVSSAAGPASVFAPGELMTVSGSQFASTTASVGSTPWPITLAGVTATVNGVAAPISSISPGQVTLQIPYETGAGWAVLGLNNNGEVASYWFQVAGAAPAILIDSTGSLPTGGAGQPYTLQITGAGDVTPALLNGAAPAMTTPPAQRPKPRLPINVTVGGAAAGIQFATAMAGRAGVTQITFTIPSNVSPGDQPVVVTVGGVASAPVNLTVTP